MQQEVVLAGQEEHVQHLRQSRHPGDEPADPATGVRLQPDGDHRLQRAPERRGVHVGVVAADDAALAQ